MNVNEPVYSTIVSVKGGRDGNVTSENGFLDLALTTPKVLGGKELDRANHLELLGAAIAACYSNAVQEAAKIDEHAEEAFADISTKIDVVKDPERGGYKLAITLLVKFFEGRYSDILDQRVIDEASGLCPIIKALEGECDFGIRIY